MFKALFSLLLHLILTTSLRSCYCYFHSPLTVKKGIKGQCIAHILHLARGRAGIWIQIIYLWDQPTRSLLLFFLLLCLCKRPSHNQCTENHQLPEKTQSSRKELRCCTVRLECHPPTPALLRCNWHTACTA